MESNGALQTKEGVTVPASYRQWTHGYVETSHKAQSQTFNRVVVAAERLDAKSAYVACSRGREVCAVHTPDKLQLFERLPEGNRPAALDVLSGLRPAQQRQSLALSQRADIWKEHCKKVVYQAVESVRSVIEERTLATREMILRWQAHCGLVQRAQESQKFAIKESEKFSFSQTQSQSQGMKISL